MYMCVTLVLRSALVNFSHPFVVMRKFSPMLSAQMQRLFSTASSFSSSLSSIASSKAWMYSASTVLFSASAFTTCSITSLLLSGGMKSFSFRHRISSDASCDRSRASSSCTRLSIIFVSFTLRVDRRTHFDSSAVRIAPRGPPDASGGAFRSAAAAAGAPPPDPGAMASDLLGDPRMTAMDLWPGRKAPPCAPGREQGGGGGGGGSGSASCAGAAAGRGGAGAASVGGAAPAASAPASASLADISRTAASTASSSRPRRDRPVVHHRGFLASSAAAALSALRFGSASSGGGSSRGAAEGFRFRRPPAPFSLEARRRTPALRFPSGGAREGDAAAAPAPFFRGPSAGASRCAPRASNILSLS